MKKSAKAGARARYSLHLPKPLYRKICRLAFTLEVPAVTVITSALDLYVSELGRK